MLRFGRGRRTVRSVNEGGIQGNALGRKVEAEFDGVVAGFAVDVDLASEAGRTSTFRRTVEPPVIRLPTVGGRNEHNLARTFVVDVILGSLIADEHFGDSFDVAEHIGHPRDVGVVADVHM